jgi:hypothetical protein
VEEPTPAPPAASAFQREGASAYAPVGLRDARVLHKGEVELDLVFALERFGGNLDDTESVGEAEIRAAGFPSTAFRMDRDEASLGVLWAPFERLTLALTIPYLATELSQHAPDGSSYTTRSDGLGDLEVAALVPFMQYRDQSIVLDLGASLPTGDISPEDETPFGRSRLAYPQRLGSGTFDLAPSITYRGFAQSFAWGGQIGGVFHLYRNHLDYQLGNRFDVSVWGAVAPVSWLSASLRAAYSSRGNIRGQDAGLPVLTQAADPNLQAGSRLDLAPGVNLALPFLGRQRLGVEAELPVFQDLDGPQLERDFRLVAGWQWTF